MSFTLSMLVGCSMSSSRRQGEALFEIFGDLFTWEVAINQGNGDLTYIAVDMSRVGIEDYSTFRVLMEEFVDERDEFTLMWTTFDELVEDGYINQVDGAYRFRKELEDGTRIGGILITFFPTGEHPLNPDETPEEANITEIIDGSYLRISARKWGWNGTRGHVTANFVVERGMSSFTLSRNNPVTATE